MAFRRRRIHPKVTQCSHDERYCFPPPPLPPLPPLPRPPPLVADDTPTAVSPRPTTRIEISNKNHALPLVVIVAASVLALCLLSLAYYAVRRYRSSRRRRSGAAAWGPPQPPSDAGGDDLLLREDLLVGGGVEEPYHVWYIRTVGLDQTVIGAITVCEYRKEEGLVESTDCAVCLGDFGEGELLRLLPKCSHAFHVPCIDTWLRSHVNCPLCRAPVLAPAPPRPPPPPLPSPAAGGENVTSEDVLEVQSSPQGQAYEEDGSEEAGNFTVLRPAQVGVDRPAAGDSFSSEESEVWVPIHLGNDGLGDETASHAAAPAERDEAGELQPVRRSVSMDSSALAGLLLRMRLAGSSRDGGRKPNAAEGASANKKGGAGENNNRKGASLLGAPLEMERCMSGGRFSLSRFAGRPRGAILPS